MALGDGILGNVILGDTGSAVAASLDALLLFFAMLKTNTTYMLQAPNLVLAKSLTSTSMILQAPNVTFTIQELGTSFTKKP
jgi:hypothetical protein